MLYVYAICPINSFNLFKFGDLGRVKERSNLATLAEVGIDKFISPGPPNWYLKP